MKIHGLYYHPLYSVWRGMKTRCYNKNAKEYKNWGARGIIVCNEWLNNPKAFIEWAISNGYKKGLQIDRPNNNGNYNPSNCRFTTNAENCRNKRNNKLNWDLVYEIRNIKLLTPNITQNELAESYGVCQMTISYILSNKIWND